MRNINELIGIIKGINFDGVINDKEVVRLQLWVDKNRDLAYETRQAELISKVDSILEDHLIDEKELLIAKSEAFLTEMEDDAGKIYELNGIIEGVVCDGVVNEAEVYRLKEWMDEFGDCIRGHRPSEKLCAVIDDILEDGVVTKDEQHQLLHMLSFRIKYSQFETKLDYLCKQVKERKNIGTDLIDILDNESAVTEIHRRAELQLIKELSSYSSDCTNREIIVISLVLVAMLQYDGNYYGSVRSTYTEVYRRYTEQKVEGFIRSILSRYKKQNDSGSRTRIINVALENAIVPQAFLSAFFEFIFDIYKMNFEYDLPDEPYEDFRFVFEGLRNNMLSDGDDISIKVTQKTYKLIAATKRLITREEGIDAVIKLSIIIVRLIDRRFWDKEVKIYNPYVKVGYECWEAQLKEKARGNREQRVSSSEFRSRWEPKYLMTNNSVYLVPPAHRVKAQYDYKELSVVVLNEGEEIYRNNNCFIKEIIGGYQINPPKIEIKKPLGILTYRLVCRDEVIYDSKDKLNRNCIAFNQEGQEISNNTDFEGTVYFCYKEGEAELQNILTKEFYCIGYKLIRFGDAIGIGHDVFNFSSMVKPGIFGQLHKKCFVSNCEGAEYIPVYKEVNVVAFEADNTCLKYEVLINDKPYKLSEMIYKTTEREAITKYVVDLDLKECGLYTVEINQIVSGKKNKILKEKFVYDNNLFFSAERLEDDQYRIVVSSDILENNIDTIISIGDFELDFIRFSYDGKEYSYLLPFNFGFYSINDGEWNTAQDDLWIEDIPLESTMCLFDSECDGLLVYTEDGTLAEDNIVVQDKGFYKKVAIGFLNSYKNGNKCVMLVFTVAGKKKYSMFCYNKCVIEEDATEIIFSNNPKRVMVTPVFRGKNRVFFELFNKAGEKVYTSKALKSGQTETLGEFNSFEKYTFNFHEKTKILMLRKNTLLNQRNKTFYAKQDFIDRVFKIETAYFDQFIRGDYVEKTYHFNKAFVRITDLVEENLFEGMIFVTTMKGEWQLDGINPVEVEICSEIIDDTMDVYMTNQGDGLLLDFEKHGILNSLEHPTAPDIFLYTVSMNREV